MHFEEVNWLFLLVILILPIFRWRGEKISSFSHIALLPKDNLAKIFISLKKILCVTAFASLVVAIARPVTDGGEIARIGRGSSILFLLDMSASMDMSLNYDSKENKWKLSEDVIARFVDKRCPKDRVALIGFGSMPITFSDFTYNCAVFTKVLKNRGVNLGATVIGWPLHNAISMLYNLETSGKAIVLISDGDGSVEQMQDLAFWIKKFGIKFYWVSIGENNAPNLNQFIQLLGSGYAEKFILTKPEDFDLAFQKIDKLEKGPIIYKEYIPIFSWKPYVLKSAFVALIVFLILSMFDFNLARALKRTKKRGGI